MYRPKEDDFIVGGIGSAEPFPKPDLKAKRHSRPRRHEKIGGGHFVFRRGDHGRVTTNGFPFEHANLGSANEEAYRLAALTGGTFEVYQCQNVVTADEARAAEAEDWDRAPTAAGKASPVNERVQATVDCDMADYARMSLGDNWDRAPLLDDMTLDMHAEVRRIGGAA